MPRLKEHYNSTVAPAARVAVGVRREGVGLVERARGRLVTSPLEVGFRLRNQVCNRPIFMDCA